MKSKKMSSSKKSNGKNGNNGKKMRKSKKTRDTKSQKNARKGRTMDRRVDEAKLVVTDSDAAGVDVGSEEHWVCVPPDRVEEGEDNVRVFECYTPNLHELIAWLKRCGIRTVALESTGVYWIPLFQLLEKAKFEVCLVNTKHMKNVKGRPKTDRLDCQWLMRLHSYGLLAPSFRPSDEICALRSYARWRETLVQDGASFIQRMCKALQQMNVRLDKAVTDVTGATGTRIIEHILAGGRDPLALAALRDPRCKKSVDEIAKALSGDFREEHVYVLKSAYESHQYLKGEIERCERKIEEQLRKVRPSRAALKAAYERVAELLGEDESDEAVAARVLEEATPEPFTDMKSYLNGLAGVDATAIPGIDAGIVQTLVSEVGLDFTKWPTSGHFTSWLGLSPCPNKSGVSKNSQHTNKVQSRAAKAFRMAALAASESDSHLGVFYRRIRSRKGGSDAITATARKMAVIYYLMIVNGTEFVELGSDYFHKHGAKRYIKKTNKRLNKLGYKIVPIDPGETEELAAAG